MNKKPLWRSIRSWSIGLSLLGMSAAGQAAVCEYRIDNQWNSGFVATISITNDGNQPLNGWELTWDYPGSTRVAGSWNANVSGSGPYTASNLSWNGNIQPGGTVSFGLQGAGAAEIPTLAGPSCEPLVTNEPPVASATVDISSGQAPLAVMFDASGSSDPDNSYGELTFEWTFSDGGSATGDVVPYTFTNAGTYTATVTVSDGESSSSQMVSVVVEGNTAPVAAATVDVANGPAPLTSTFDASASSDADGDSLTYFWDFGDGTTSNQAVVSHSFVSNGSYDVVLTVSDGEFSDSTTVSIYVGDEHVRVDNPFRNTTFYVDPVWSAKAAAEPGGEYIADVNTAVWMDRIGAITDGIGLRGHLDEAIDQGVGMFMFVVYDLPNRDCAALASNGELRIADGGMQRYKDEYIGPIVDIISDPKYRTLNIVAIIEVDSLPNLVTNLDIADCAEADGPDGYRDGIRYALNQLSTVENVYSYVDIAHSGWLGWSSNFGPAVDLIGEVVESTDAGWDSVAGFVSNSANYTPTVEPYLPDPQLAVGGMPIRSATFYEWNDYFEEKAFVQDWREAMIARGAPTTLGMLIDTSRNGWGGPNRPDTHSQATSINAFVNQSRIDRRFHRGNWCNQPGGIGFKPWADPYEGIDAFVWVKPPGESDGVADPNFTPDPNDPAKQHDGMCDPTANNRYAPSVKTGAMANAPHAGRWFPEQFAKLIDNAYPPVTDPAGPPPPPPPPRDDCAGLNPSKPVVLSAGARVELDLGCEAPVYVRFSSPLRQSLFVENTGDPFNVIVTRNGSSFSAEGYFKGLDMPGATSVSVERIDAATTIELRAD